MSWAERPFGELLAEPVRNGLYKRAEFRGRGVPIVKMGELFAEDFLVGGTADQLELNEREWRTALLAIGDLLFARRSYVLEGSGKSSLVVRLEGPTTFESSVIRARPDRRRAEPRFLYYFFKSSLGRERVQAIASRTAVSGIRGSDLPGVRVPAPPLNVQQKIAAVLTVYDELIANNLRRIEILEQIARSIYREWFVALDYPPSAETALDPGKQRVAQGWSVISLGELLTVLESGGRPKGGIDSKERAIPSVGAENIIGLGKYDFSKEKFISEDFYQRMKKGHVQSRDVLLYKDGAYIGRTSMFGDGFPHANLAINEHVFRLRSDPDVPQTFLYFWLSQPETTQRLRDLNSNAAQPGISQQKLRTLEVTVPPGDLLKRFDEVVNPVVTLIFNLAKQNRVLQRTRDLLLPKLISGEIDVSELEIDTSWLAA